MTNAFDLIAKFPRASLMTAATPVEPLRRVSRELGIEVMIKRDDLTGLGFGGNKIRQLEFYFGAALAQGADTVLITGAVQSNYVRAAAAAAAKLGLEAVVQLEERVPGMESTYYSSGNVLLDDLLGARRISFPEGENEAGADQSLRGQAEMLREAGRRPYVIPLSAGNPPLGALGYMLAAREIVEQDIEFDCAVIGSGSGLTHVGLLAGLRALGNQAPVHGACVRRAAQAQRKRLEMVSADLASLLGGAQFIKGDDLLTWDMALEPGYGQLGPAALEAITMMARYEGLFLDPVYTAKSFAVLVALARAGSIPRGSRVLFVHTGGLPALFAYEPLLRPAQAAIPRR